MVSHKVPPVVSESPESVGRLPLRRRRPPEAQVSSDEMRRTIDAILSVSRRLQPGRLGDEKSAELERSFQQLEEQLAHREYWVAEMEDKQAERQRDLWEAEALIAAREKLVESTRRINPATAMGPDTEAALKNLKWQVERQEVALEEKRRFAEEREKFLEENEMKLMDKIQALQEKEVELEQKAEDLGIREECVSKGLAKLAAAKDQPEKTLQVHVFDEFRE